METKLFVQMKVCHWLCLIRCSELEIWNLLQILGLCVSERQAVLEQGSDNLHNRYRTYPSAVISCHHVAFDPLSDLILHVEDSPLETAGTGYCPVWHFYWEKKGLFIKWFWPLRVLLCVCATMGGRTGGGTGVPGLELSTCSSAS